MGGDWKRGHKDSGVRRHKEVGWPVREHQSFSSGRAENASESVQVVLAVEGKARVEGGVFGGQ